MTPTEEFKAKALAAGADLVGVADLSSLKREVPTTPPGLMEPFTRARGLRQRLSFRSEAPARLRGASGADARRDGATGGLRRPFSHGDLMDQPIMIHQAWKPTRATSPRQPQRWIEKCLLSLNPFLVAASCKSAAIGRNVQRRSDKIPLRRGRAAGVVSALAIPVLGLFALPLPAEEVRFQNGDHYAGQVLSLNTNTLVLQSALMGNLSLPRSRVTAIMLAPAADGELTPATNRNDEVRMRNGDCLGGRVLSLNSNSLLFLSPILGKVSLPRCEVAFIALKPLTTNKNAPALSNTNLDAPPLPAGDLATVLSQYDPNSGTVQDLKSQLLSNAGPVATQKFNEMLAGLMSGKMTVDDIRSQAQSVSAQARALKRDLGADPAAEALDGYLDILDRFLQQTTPPMVAKPAAK